MRRSLSVSVVHCNLVVILSAAKDPLAAEEKPWLSSA
jgi:hypothetical protein